MENKNMIIILVLIFVIVALLIGIFATMPNFSKQNTNLTFKSEYEITEGNNLKFVLTDYNGTAIGNQTVNVTITAKDKTSDSYSVVTYENGVGKLKLDSNPGKYEVTIVYGGNDNYNGCNATTKIKIIEDAVETEVTSTSSQSSSLPYSIDNLPPSNDPNPETRRYQVDENTVIQEYSDNYRSIVDLRTGERHGGWF